MGDGIVLNSEFEGEYKNRGEYHKHLDPNWSYYPVYIRKVAFVDKYINKYDPEAKILDAGCGEGVLVEKYRAQGFDISGIDLNVSSEHVLKGDILHMPYKEVIFDLVLFLDVIEHFKVQDQHLALVELRRVMKDDGNLIISIPNLAHKASRWQFYRTGELIRTANINKHPGDRPIKEYLSLINEAGFVIKQRLPIKLTLPPFQETIYKIILGRNRYEKLIYSSKRNPDDCFLNIFVLEKDK